MSEKTPSKDEALEALDFIVNVLKEHEKDLDRLVSELGTVAGQMGDSGEINSKVRKIEDKINSLQDNVSSLVKSLSNVQKEKVAEHVQVVPKEEQKAEVARQNFAPNMPLTLKCKQWDDFQSLASQAQTVSYTFKEQEKTLEVNAIKDNHVISYSGEIPKLPMLLKVYLSKQLGVLEKQILEGAVSLS